MVNIGLFFCSNALPRWGASVILNLWDINTPSHKYHVPLAHLQDCSPGSDVEATLKLKLIKLQAIHILKLWD